MRQQRIHWGILAVSCLLAEGAAGQSRDWTLMPVPGTWDQHAPEPLAEYDGFAWYRCQVTVPAGWRDRRIELHVAEVDNAHEAYVGGEKVGGAGALPPEYRSGLAEPGRYAVPAEAVAFGKDNVIALRVYDHDGRGGFKGAAPVLVAGNQAIALNGTWEFRTGDDAAWAQGPLAITETAIFWRVMPADAALELAKTGGGLEPAAAIKTFAVPDDLKWELVLAEPDIAQPLFLNFDERGRLWVMEYRQYPYPAGLKMVSKDEYWRAVYDKVPEPPPHGERGADRISIHEDTDGDGTFDAHKVFVDGLNIASSFARGRGGVWVLNPPYLLFYPDRDGDDVPDAEPEIHLEGFGMEDTHSVANSLRWGPDGWLYAAQGSTVSGNVKRYGTEEKPVYTQGQLIWRYHPEVRKYEIFAEGGGNAFGVEIDAVGRIFSGHNGGDTRGFHYVQGGYSQKGFAKHGPLSNPYAFGYFPAMKHPPVERFTHNFILYDGGALPERYDGHLFGIEPLQGRLVEADMTPDGSTFRTQDLGHPVTTTDRNFRPVDIKVGPDGAIYVADFYEPQISHREHFSGQIDKTTGRVWRLAAKSGQPLRTFDLGNASTEELVGYLQHENKWFRQTALRIIGDRGAGGSRQEAVRGVAAEGSVVALLLKEIDESDGQLALECLWALHQSGGLDDERALALLDHSNEFVRQWTARLACDDGDVLSPLARKLAELAAMEPSVYVRSQLASSARRLAAADALPIVRGLLGRSEDVGDPHLPLLLWWAIERKCGEDPQAVLSLFGDGDAWGLPMVEQHILHRLMQRFAAAGSRTDLLVCARLLELSPNEASPGRLMAGFEEAFKGRPLAGLPAELVQALARAGGGSLVLRVRQGQAEAVEEALRLVADADADKSERLACIQAFGEVDQPECVPVLLDVLEGSQDEELRRAALTALGRYAEERIGSDVLALLPSLTVETRSVALSLLAGRKAWSRQLLEAVDAGRVDAEAVPIDLVRQMTFHQDERVAELIAKHWESLDGASTAQMQEQIRRLTAALASGPSDPYQGKALYTQTCAKCHILFGEGGRIGPELTTYKRDDIGRMLASVVNPSAEIREGFESVLVLTLDGRTAAGFLYDQDNRVVVLRGTDGQTVTIAREEIDEIVPQKKSLMPEGLLSELTDQQARDLFAYLRSSQPLNR